MHPNKHLSWLRTDRIPIRHRHIIHLYIKKSWKSIHQLYQVTPCYTPKNTHISQGLVNVSCWFILEILKVTWKRICWRWYYGISPVGLGDVQFGHLEKKNIDIMKVIIIKKNTMMTVTKHHFFVVIMVFLEWTTNQPVTILCSSRWSVATVTSNLPTF